MSGLLRSETDLLLQAGRLLLAYNESTGAIHRALTATAKTLTDEACHVFVSYGGIAVALGHDGTAIEPVGELRYNMGVQARVHAILGQVRQSRLGVEEALSRLSRVEADTPRHSRWLAAALLGAAAAALAGLLGADGGAAAVAGVATALGLLARQALGHRQVRLLVLPLTATFIGGILGGMAIRLGATQSPELVLIVPALMVVPGPHFINGLLDLIDNHLPMSLARLWLATGILLASALGIVIAVELTIPSPLFPEHASGADGLNLASDMTLAAVVTLGFGAFYNTPWRALGMAAAGGAVGHGVRFLALQAGGPLEAATLLGGLTVGAIAAWLARSSKTPVAVIAFAGAVTMIPGLSLYRALGGALQLARRAEASDPTTVAATLGHTAQGCLVVGALAIGLIVGTRVVAGLTRGREPTVAIHQRGVDSESPDESRHDACELKQTGRPQ